MYKSNKLLCGILLGLILFIGCSKKVNQWYEYENFQELTEVVDLPYAPPARGSFGHPEEYAVVLHCQHGNFVISENQDSTRELWGNLMRGQKLSIKVTKVYLVTQINDTLKTRLLAFLNHPQ